MKPPSPTQRTYVGRNRRNIRSALNHVNNLVNQNTRYEALPTESYPNQLCSPADLVKLDAVKTMFTAWLESEGPIPSHT